MHYSQRLQWLTAAVLSAAMGVPCLAQDKDKPAAKASGQAGEAAMMARMMELAKPSEGHKLLANGVGFWSYTVKMWMGPDPKAPPSESSGTAMVKPVMGGRFFIGEHTGKMQIPGLDGKMTDMEFKGMAIEGYDNVKRKYVATWIDNMGTGMLNMEGDYDTASKTFTYRGTYEMMPGMTSKIREVIKVPDNSHHTFEYYEDRGNGETKTMEIEYTRKKP